MEINLSPIQRKYYLFAGSNYGLIRKFAEHMPGLTDAEAASLKLAADTVGSIITEYSKRLAWEERKALRKRLDTSALELVPVEDKKEGF